MRSSVYKTWAMRWGNNVFNPTPSRADSVNNETSENRKETARLEAFSDGIFAVAITLLVLDLRAPDPASLPPGGLSVALLNQWPAYVAYVISFVTILIMWVNHHSLFKRIVLCDHWLLLLNGLLLMSITFVAFPTSLVSHFIQEPDGKVAAAVYSFTFVVNAVMWNAVWRYASYNNRLLDKNTPPGVVKAVNRSTLVGSPFYLIAFVMAFVNVYASVGICALLAAFYAISPLASGAVPE